MSLETPACLAQPASAPARPMDPRAGWLLLVLIAGLWGILCVHLSAHWSANPQYSFGWLVPWLSLYLGYLRWSDRPSPAAPGAWTNTLLLAAVAFGPTWLVAQPNPEWRLVSWLLALEVVALSLWALSRIGGPPWARHFAFPVCLILAAVPWPSGPEAMVIGGLMQAVAAFTVAVLNITGIPALQHGNLIEIKAGLLGVDEACSGVRSLQATLMAALAMGELYRFPVSRRFLLLFLGVGVALATNAGRAFLLAWTAAREGIAAVSRWHDPAGYTVMTICFVLVWLVALLLCPKATATAAPVRSGALRFPPVRVTAGLLCWFALVLIATEAWFRSGEHAPGPRWTFAWPAPGAQQFKELPIAENAAAMLQHDVGKGATWVNSEREQWLVYHFLWSAGPSRSRILARMHRPEHCLPSTGWQLVEDRGTLTIQRGGLSLPFRALRFAQGNRTVHVWFCQTEDRRPGSGVSADFESSARAASLQAVLRRERSLGQQVLEAVLFSPASGAEADDAFRREVVPRIQPAVPK